jgi:hypothetical protein
MTTSELEPSTWVPELTFGARLALIRHHNGWNIKEAATACGLPPQSWRGWEIQGHEPHRRTTIAMTIATRTGCDYLWLVHGPSRGGAVPSSAYVGTRVLVTAGRSTHAGPSGHPGDYTNPGRPVRQTRPIVGASRRPLAPSVL